MSRVSSNPTNLTVRGAPQSARPDTPADALARLRLTGPAAAPWMDIVRLDAPALARVARAVDDERQAVEQAYGDGTKADEALKKIEELLAEADTLAVANAKSGVGRRARRDNQTKIDALLADVGRAAKEAGAEGRRVLDGSATLKAGGRGAVNAESLTLERVALDTLGRVTVAGKTVTLRDLRTRGELDTSTGRAASAAGAKRSLDAAQETVAAMRKEVQGFQRDALVPRLGDVATAMEGLFTSTSPGNSEAALQLARDLREMMLASSALAVGVAAEGWDRQRVLELLT